MPLGLGGEHGLVGPFVVKNPSQVHGAAVFAVGLLVGIADDGVDLDAEQTPRRDGVGKVPIEAKVGIVS